MYTNSSIREDIYQVNFAGTTRIVDIRVADCIALSIRMALAKYDGILALLQGDNFIGLYNLIDTSGSNSNNDAFSEEFLSKCGIYHGDKLYKPKRSVQVMEKKTCQVVVGAEGASTSPFAFSRREFEDCDLLIDLGFSSLDGAICQLQDMSDDSDGSDWDTGGALHTIVLYMYEQSLLPLYYMS